MSRETIEPYRSCRNKNPALEEITITPYAQSETRYILPITVNPKHVPERTGNSFTLCDTPGFGDTAGPEVDIANGF
ncbi:unnamed protein product, partial [Rotaria sp. Silwood1]